MGHDDFDEMLPPDEDAQDFSHFDPDSYLRRRGLRDSDTSDDRLETDPENFDNFDPEAYLRKRSAQRGQPPLDSTSYAPGEPPRRRRRSGVEDSDLSPDMADAAGLGAGLLNLLHSPEEARFGFRVLREASPLIRMALLLVGCAIVFVLAVACVLGFWLATALTRR